MRALRDNPIIAFTRRDYEAPIVVRRTLLGDVALVSDPAGVRHVLVENAANYRRDPFQQSMLRPGLGESLLTAEGEAWRRQRRLISGLFTPRAIARFAVGMSDGAAALCERWRARSSVAEVENGAEKARLTLDALARTAFEGRAGSELDAIPDAVTRYINQIGRLDPMDALQAPAWAPRWNVWRARPQIAVFDRVAEAIAARGGSGVDCPTLVDVLTPESGCSRNELLGNIRTFLFAGYESTAISLTWSLYLLSLDQAWRERVEGEADAAAGVAPERQLEALPATRATVEEALRLYPPVATISRQAQGPDEICGQPIRKGDVVVVAPWVSHRSRRYWSEPDAFDPERFLSPRRETIDRFAYLPFGVGPRTCIGAGYAVQEAVIALAAIVRAFRLDHDPARPPWPVLRMTLRPRTGFTMILSRRAAA
jgi:cytochrome P450